MSGRAMFALFLVAMLLPVTRIALATDGPAPFRASYELRVNGVRVGERIMTLERLETGAYRLAARTEPRGIGNLFYSRGILETTRFRFLQGRLRPFEYRYHRAGRKPRRVHLRFDWQAHRVTNDIDGNRWQMKIPDDALDKLLVQLAIALDLARGLREVRYHVADGGKLKEFRFEVTGREDVVTPAGRFATLKLRRERRDQDRTTHLWCAETIGFLPVRIRQEEHEEPVIYESLLLEYEAGKKAR